MSESIAETAACWLVLWAACTRSMLLIEFTQSLLPGKAPPLALLPSSTTISHLLDVVVINSAMKTNAD